MVEYASWSVPVFLLLLCVVLGCRGEETRTPEPPAPVDPMVVSLMARAQWAEEQGASVTALSVYATIHRRAPDYATAHFRRGQLLTKLHRYADAEDALNRSRALEPDLDGVHFALGNNSARQGRYAEALAYYQSERARSSSGDGMAAFHAVLIQIARTHRALNDADEAVAALRDAIEVDPAHAEAYDELAAIHEENGDLDEALEMRKRALELDPDNGDYAYFLGALLVRLGRPNDAIPHLEQARTDRPWFYGIYYNLGRSFVATGDVEEGRQYIAVADSLQKVDAELGVARTTAEVHGTAEKWRHYGDMLVQAERYREALDAYHVALSLDPQDEATVAAIESIRTRRR